MHRMTTGATDNWKQAYLDKCEKYKDADTLLLLQGEIHVLMSKSLRLLERTNYLPETDNEYLRRQFIQDFRILSHNAMVNADKMEQAQNERKRK